MDPFSPVNPFNPNYHIIAEYATHMARLGAQQDPATRIQADEAAAERRRAADAEAARRRAEDDRLEREHASRVEEREAGLRWPDAKPRLAWLNQKIDKIRATRPASPLATTTFCLALLAPILYAAASVGVLTTSDIRKTSIGLAAAATLSLVTVIGLGTVISTVRYKSLLRYEEERSELLRRRGCGDASCHRCIRPLDAQGRYDGQRRPILIPVIAVIALTAAGGFVAYEDRRFVPTWSVPVGTPYGSGGALVAEEAGRAFFFFRLATAEGGDQLLAIDLSDGSRAWQKPMSQHTSEIQVTAAGSILIAQLADGSLSAFSSADGALLWEWPSPAVSASDKPTVWAYNNVVIVWTYGSSTTVNGIDPSAGKILWTRPASHSGTVVQTTRSSDNEYGTHGYQDATRDLEFIVISDGAGGRIAMRPDGQQVGLGQVQGDYYSSDGLTLRRQRISDAKEVWNMALEAQPLFMIPCGKAICIFDGSRVTVVDTNTGKALAVDSIGSTAAIAWGYPGSPWAMFTFAKGEHGDQPASTLIVSYVSEDEYSTRLIDGKAFPLSPRSVLMVSNDSLWGNKASIHKLTLMSGDITLKLGSATFESSSCDAWGQYLACSLGTLTPNETSVRVWKLPVQ